VLLSLHFRGALAYVLTLRLSLAVPATTLKTSDLFYTAVNFVIRAVMRLR
jgi:hypothetical protein